MTDEIKKTEDSGGHPITLQPEPAETIIGPEGLTVEAATESDAEVTLLRQKAAKLEKLEQLWAYCQVSKLAAGQVVQTLAPVIGLPSEKF